MGCFCFSIISTPEASISTGSCLLTLYLGVLQVTPTSSFNKELLLLLYQQWPSLVSKLATGGCHMHSLSIHLFIATLSAWLQSCPLSWTITAASQHPSQSVLHRSLAKQEQTEIKMSIKNLSQQPEGQSQQETKSRALPSDSR